MSLSSPSPRSSEIYTEEDTESLHEPVVVDDSKETSDTKKLMNIRFQGDRGGTHKTCTDSNQIDFLDRQGEVDAKSYPNQEAIFN